MAISHIPKSVGHNFTPEYQISSIPYVVDLSSDLVSTFFVKKNDNSAVVGHSETNNGFVYTHGVVPDTDIFNDDINVDGIIQDSEKKADNLKAGFTLVEVKTLKLPKISRWIQFLPTGDGIDVAFSRTDILLENFLTFTSNSSQLEIRCTNLYFDTKQNGKIAVGLTSIDRSEFTEVVETFLGD
tara:strand:+ start:677 stop:1228 length:552 start_codon:yes stop_codon:yes gene_type:complete